MAYYLFYKTKLVGDKVGDKDRTHGLNQTRQKNLSETRHNSNITKAQPVVILGISDTAVDNAIRFLREGGYIRRIGENKNGYWEVIN